MIRNRQLSLLHIRHIHSHPWWDVYLTAYDYCPKDQLYHEMTVGIAYNAHPCDEEMLLPVVNSPQVGVCGYTG